MGENFKFLSANKITNSDQLSASSGTATLSLLIDRTTTTQWISSGTGTASATWSPTVATEIDRIMLQNHNLADYMIVSGTGTLVSVSGNTETESYHEITAETIGTVGATVYGTQTIAANEPRAIGQLVFTTETFEVGNNPDDYQPIVRKKGFDLEMADGGAKSVFLGEKFRASLRFSFVSTSEQQKFEDLYDAHESFYFVPTPSTTTWDGDAWTVNWVGDKDILKLTNGITKTVGFDIIMSIWEISS